MACVNKNNQSFESIQPVCVVFEFPIPPIVIAEERKKRKFLGAMSILGGGCESDASDSFLKIV